MAEPGLEDQDDLKKKLVRRIAIAGVLVVVLLGGLTLVENYLVEQPAPPASAAKPDAASVPDKAEGKPAEALKTEPKAEEKAAEMPAEPEKTETPLAPAPEPSSRVVIKAGPAAPPAPPAPAKMAEPAPAKAAAPPAASAPPDPATVIARSYRLQMGVFTTASNAEELHAKLEKAGIPAYVESRVHVGPFRTQKEADEARRRLKELGLGPGLLIPPQKK
ncbi:MAG: hypothetical protein CVU20_01900 [Betaproteobacteria bacterium HGW-Betaproteobacteria-14]|nr:MAG: hypothetical protein CVU20_01900 [Betaproteobacteria bacterium HGW-Betaproteobacteria-14]